MEFKEFFVLCEPPYSLFLCGEKKRDRSAEPGWRCAAMVSEEKRSEEESFFTLREALLFRVFVVRKMQSEHGSRLALRADGFRGKEVGGREFFLLFVKFYCFVTSW